MTPEQVLAISRVSELQELDHRDFTHAMTEPEFRHIFELCDALWLHSGDPAQPHAQLTSGKCSNGFIDTLRALRFSNICHLLAEQLVRKLVGEDGYDYYAKHGDIHWVVGSDHAGAAFSHSVAIRLGTQHDFTEKGPDKTQMWKRFTVEPGEVVLQVEELITTTGTLQAVRDGIRSGNPYPVTFAPVVMTLVHRSNVYEIEGSPILYFVHYDIEVWEPAECPLCAAGSKRLRAKQNWAELTGKK